MHIITVDGSHLINLAWVGISLTKVVPSTPTQWDIDATSPHNGFAFSLALSLCVCIYLRVGRSIEAVRGEASWITVVDNARW